MTSIERKKPSNEGFFLQVMMPYITPSSAKL